MKKSLTLILFMLAACTTATELPPDATPQTEIELRLLPPLPEPAPRALCGEVCRSAVDCGTSPLCRICGGMPGTGKGQCLSGNP